MAIYAIGDVQGCFDELVALLDKISFDKSKDSLWLTGDLINRGPNSLETLRYIKNLGDSTNSVLGNHDLHILAMALTPDKNNKSKNINNDIKRLLDAPDCDELLTWLRMRPLIHHDITNNFVITHAGIYPQWTLDQAISTAHATETMIQSDDFITFLDEMYGNKPTLWNEDLSGTEKKRFAINAFTRMRFCDKDYNLLFDYKRDLKNKPAGYIPWYDLPRKTPQNTTIVFGHWSALGLMHTNNILSLDTGCLWGGDLTAAQLDGPEITITSISCKNNPIK